MGAVAAAANYGGALINDTSSDGDHVRVLTVDGLGLDAVNLLKIDVEGMELSVLRGADETIERYRPTVYLEDNELSQSYPPTIRYMHSKG